MNSPSAPEGGSSPRRVRCPRCQAWASFAPANRWRDRIVTVPLRRPGRVLPGLYPVALVTVAASGLRGAGLAGALSPMILAIVPGSCAI